MSDKRAEVTGEELEVFVMKQAGHDDRYNRSGEPTEIQRLAVRMNSGEVVGRDEQERIVRQRANRESRMFPIVPTEAMKMVSRLGWIARSEPTGGATS